MDETKVEVEKKDNALDVEMKVNEEKIEEKPE